MLTENVIYLNQVCHNQESAELILDSIYTILTPILNSTKCPKDRTTTTTCQETAMNNCDRLFNTYNNMLNDPIYNNEKVMAAYNQYQIQRKSLHAETAQKVDKSILDSRNDKKLWALIDWSGKSRTTSHITHPSMLEMSEHFQML